MGLGTARCFRLQRYFQPRRPADRIEYTADSDANPNLYTDGYTHYYPNLYADGYTYGNIYAKQYADSHVKRNSYRNTLANGHAD